MEDRMNKNHPHGYPHTQGNTHAHAHDTNHDKNQEKSPRAETSKMTRQQAGRKGGLAQHKCRGRGCQRAKTATNNLPNLPNNW